MVVKYCYIFKSEFCHYGEYDYICRLSALRKHAHTSGLTGFDSVQKWWVSVQSFEVYAL